MRLATLCTITQELAILSERHPNALAFLVDRRDVQNRAAITGNRLLDQQIVEAARIVTGLRLASPHGYALFIRTHAKFPRRILASLGSGWIVV
jgi:hypothetical protein